MNGQLFSHARRALGLVLVLVAAIVLVPAVAHAATVRCEQTSAEFSAAGAWSTWSNAVLSGGSYLFTNSSGSSVTITFEGTQATLIARQGPEMGAGEVFVDGVPVQPYVCLYSPTTLYKQPVYTTQVLEPGRHTLTFRWTGFKNPASSNSYINIDAVEIIPADAPPIQGATSVEQDDPHLLTLGGWNAWSSGLLSGGSYAYSNNMGAMSAISFEGTRLDLLTRTGPEFGYAKVTLDGQAQYVDLYSATTQYQQTVFSTWALDSGPHTIRVEWSGRKNPASAGTYVNVDSFKIVGALVQATRRYEQTDAPFCKADTWGSFASALLSGGSYVFTDAPGAQTCILYEGSEIDVICRKGPEFGIMEVSIDDGPPTLVDLYSENTLYQQTVYTAAPSNGLHTVKISRTGEKNPLATGTNINVDAADIMWAQAPAISGHSRVEQNDPRLLASGVWNTWASPSLSGGNYAYTNTPGSHVTAIFYGTRLDYVARTGPEMGFAKVTFDGVPRFIDLYSPTTQYKQLAFSTWDRNAAVHVVRVEWCNRKNPSSSGTWVNVDAFDIKGTFLPTPARVEQNSPAVSLGGAWGTWSNASLSGTSYAYANTSGAQATFTVDNASAVTLIARTGPEFGIAKVQVDGGSWLDVNLYSPVTQYRQRVATLRLQPGPHTITVTWADWKDSAATNTYINVDAFDVWAIP